MPHAQPIAGPEAPGLAEIDRDAEGYLLDANARHPGLTEPLAKACDLVLTPERPEIVRYLRAYFEQNFRGPKARELLKHLQAVWGQARATRRHLCQLFPRGRGQQASKITGMRKPRRLMLDV